FGNSCNAKHRQVGCRGRTYTPEVQCARKCWQTAFAESPTRRTRTLSVFSEHSHHAFRPICCARAQGRTAGSVGEAERVEKIEGSTRGAARAPLRNLLRGDVNR